MKNVPELAKLWLYAFGQSMSALSSYSTCDSTTEITICLTDVRNTALDAMKELQIKPEEWKYAHTPQEAFIGSTYEHALIKLNSAVAGFVNAMFLSDEVMLKHSIFDIEYYIDVMAKEIAEPRTLTATNGEAKAPLVAKRTRKKGKK